MKRIALLFVVLSTWYLSAQDQAVLSVEYNHEDFDVRHQILKFEVDPEIQYVKGEVTTVFKAVNPLNYIVLDLHQNLKVEAILQGGKSLEFSHTKDHKLKINLLNSLNESDQASVTIKYQGSPPFDDSIDSYFVTSTTQAGTPILWTLSEPYGPREWWPCKQTLNDKIELLDVYITAPKEYTSVSNGVEVEIESDDVSKTTHFKHQYPIPPYLVAIAVSKYDKYIQTAGQAPNEFPIINYFYPENYQQNVEAVQITTKMVDYLEARLGLYPFNKEHYGHAEFSWHRGGGMEHTTMSFMAGFDKELIAHELAHQWFGNKVTCKTWNEIWINEGLAEYFAQLAIQYAENKNENLENSDALRTYVGYVNYSSSGHENSVYIPDNKLSDVYAIFDWAITYNKGPMIIHMLRKLVGDQAFFDGVKTFINDPELAFGFSGIDEFKAHMENAYGKSLDTFFDQWVYQKGFPTFSVLLEKLPGCNQSKITIEQRTTHSSVPYFVVPLEINFINSQTGQDQLMTFNLNSKRFEHNLELSFEVDQIEINPNYNLLTEYYTDDSYFIDENQDNQLFLSNPSLSGLITIQFACDYKEIQSIKVFNVTGHLMQTYKNQQTISIAPLPKGVYSAVITSTEGMQYTKTVIKD